MTSPEIFHADVSEKVICVGSGTVLIDLRRNCLFPSLKLTLKLFFAGVEPILLLPRLLFYLL